MVEYIVKILLCSIGSIIFFVCILILGSMLYDEIKERLE